MIYIPYKSEQQRKFFHSKGARKAGITAHTVKKWDKESKGLTNKKLPKRVKRKGGKK